MKKLILILALCTSSINYALAQPNIMNYQGVARNASGTILSNQAIGLRISLLNKAGTTVRYSETQNTTTNPYGLFNLKIGNGTIVTGTIDSLKNQNESILRIEIDPTGGTAYVPMPDQELASVPYAFMAKSLLPTSEGGWGIRSNSIANLWLGIYEQNEYRGYIGSYAGKSEDVDFGTGAGNLKGSVHLTVLAIPKLTVDSIGRVGIGNRFPKHRLQVDGTTGSFYDAGIRIENTTATTGWSFYPSASGDLIIGKNINLGSFSGITGVYTSISDKRLKTNIRKLEPVLNKVMNIEINRYEFKHNNEQHLESIGYIAQDLQTIFPEFVSEHKSNDGNPLVQNQLGVDYAGMSTVAIKAIQEQQQQIDDLKKEIEVLKQLIHQNEK